MLWFSDMVYIGIEITKYCALNIAWNVEPLSDWSDND